MSKPPETSLPGPQTRAVAVAYAEFAKSSDRLIERYQVLVTTHDDSFEVVFVPDPDPGVTVLGGRTSAGPEMHFWVSRSDYSLLKSSFAR
ncbi:MAG: hypothetical protein JO133_03505 [Burkholderiaceae bacterium]|nr:hypothetical protein [Burkholderiaceae bacterium]